MAKFALATNREWNTKVGFTEQGEVAKEIVEEFNTLWFSPYRKVELYVYPVMWTSNNSNISKGCIAVFDKMLLSAMP